MGEPESSRKNAREQICDRPCTDCRDHGSDSDRGEISETGDRNDRGDDCNADFRVNADGSERFSRLLGETGNKSFHGEHCKSGIYRASDTCSKHGAGSDAEQDPGNHAVRGDELKRSCRPLNKQGVEECKCKLYCLFFFDLLYHCNLAEKQE